MPDTESAPDDMGGSTVTSSMRHCTKLSGGAGFKRSGLSILDTFYGGGALSFLDTFWTNFGYGLDTSCLEEPGFGFLDTLWINYG